MGRKKTTTIVLASPKGGCGKTTLATCLAAELLARGLRVLLADGDHPQYSAIHWAQIAGGCSPNAVAVAADMHKPGKLDAMAATADVVIIDPPGRAEGVLASALLASDLALMPVQASGHDIRALASALGLVRTAQMKRPKLKGAIVLNRVDKRSTLDREVREDVSGTEFSVLDTEIGQRAEFRYTARTGKGPDEDTAAAEDMAALVDELAAKLKLKTQWKAMKRKSAKSSNVIPIRVVR